MESVLDTLFHLASRDKKVTVDRMVAFSATHIIFYGSRWTKQYLLSFPIQEIHQRWNNYLLKIKTWNKRIQNLCRELWHKQESAYDQPLNCFTS